MTTIATLFSDLVDLINLTFFTKDQSDNRYVQKTDVVNSIQNGNTGVPTSDAVYDYIDDVIGDLDDYIEG